VPLGRVLWSAVLAGILAGLLAATFHFMASEPVIDRAIALEAPGEEPLVSRELQKAGLFLGFLIYGLTWSLLFGAVFHVVQRWLPGATPSTKGWVLAGAAFWSTALFPFLKHPANPPGVGDPETITTRQLLFLLCIVLSIATAALAVWLARSRGAQIGVAAMVVVHVALYVLLPATADAIAVPADLLASFRVLSAVGLAFFWAVIGLTFGLLLRRHEPRAELRPRTSVV
jgi:predicted cobalt transporter CbtA